VPGVHQRINLKCALFLGHASKETLHNNSKLVELTIKALFSTSDVHEKYISHMHRESLVVIEEAFSKAASDNDIIKFEIGDTKIIIIY